MSNFAPLEDILGKFYANFYSNLQIMDIKKSSYSGKIQEKLGSKNLKKILGIFDKLVINPD